MQEGKKNRSQTTTPLPASRHPPFSRSSAPATTTSRTSTSRFRSARSPPSPASAAAARARWSKTFSTTSSPRRCIARAPCPARTTTIRGIEQINKVIRVDQQPLGNTPTSNPATYTGVFDLIRQLFSQLPESKLRGYTAAAVQLQRARRAVRGVRGQRPEVHPDALPARRVGRVRNVPRPALQPRRARSALPRQEHRRRARHVVRPGGRAVRATSRRFAASCKRCATSASITSRSAKARRRSPAAKPSA